MGDNKKKLNEKSHWTYTTKSRKGKKRPLFLIFGTRSLQAQVEKSSKLSLINQRKKLTFSKNKSPYIHNIKKNLNISKIQLCL